MSSLATVMGALGLAACAYYTLLFTIATVATRSRRSRRTATHPAPPHQTAHRLAPLVVAIVPARDEAVVIQRTVERIQQLDGAPMLLVVDDGSTDGTSELACAVADPSRTLVLRRDPPDAGTGKGAVLNAAAAHVTTLVRELDPRFGGRSLDQVVLCIVDADGWLDPDAIPIVLPHFDDPRVAGVQVSVRMWNARAGFLARMQDIEFVAYGHLFQAARSVIGSALMGGNGQFMRLSAIEQLGPRPWSDCLTEDLDIGLRLLQRGWHLRACPDTHVAQQALTEPARFVRQRARWVHGHLSCWRHIAPIWSPYVDQPIRARADLTLHLLLGSYGLLAAAQLLVVAALATGGLAWHDLPTFGPPITSAGLVVAIMLLPIVLVAITYQRHAEARVPLPALAGVLVAYGAYHYLWSVPATGLALTRMALRRTHWTKTARSAISRHDLAADAVAIGARR